MKISLIDRESIFYLVDRLENFEKDKAIRTGLNSAARVFISGGKSLLKSRLIKGDKGYLRNSFVARLKKGKPGALAGFRRGKEGGNHAHLVDRGTIKRPHPRQGTSGIMPANHFWDDARTQKEGAAMSKLMEGVASAVERINNRR